MNKHQYKLKVDELEFDLSEKIKEFDYQKGEFGRLKTAFKMSEKQIKNLETELKTHEDLHSVSNCDFARHNDSVIRFGICGNCKGTELE